MKKGITSRGAPRDKKTGKAAWIKVWNELPQEKIQGWIETLIRHIQEVIQHDGGMSTRRAARIMMLEAGRAGGSKVSFMRIKIYLQSLGRTSE
jgi:hypothetical protein